MGTDIGAMTTTFAIGALGNLTWLLMPLVGNLGLVTKDEAK